MFNEYLEPPRVERPVSLAPAFGYSTFSKSFTVIFGITISMFTSSSEASSSGDVSSAESTHIKGRVPLHLSSGAGDSNGTYHLDEKEPYIEEFVIEE
ncbi:hypothetical protein Tco_1057062 [Tanacetum coccineum]|uniref:Uncharacterized protein n=1 Tax=Tanacetum coccineum TaxID=301880 RepID=A0ABQ5H513_9ASTR